MARESELPMDSDPFDLNSFNEDINNPMLTHSPNQNNVVATSSTFPFQLVNLNFSNRNQTSHETLKEIDFFKVNNIDHNKGKKIAFSLDNGHIDTNLLEFKLNTGTGLNLLSPNTSSDQSTVNDDGMSPTSDDKRIKNQMAILQGELDRTNMENHRLKLMLGQLQANYNSLRMHFDKVMHDRMVERKSKEKERTKNDGALDPSKFIDLELAPNVETEMNLDPSSSSMGRKRSRDELRSPTNNTNVASNELVLQKNKSIVSDGKKERGKGIEKDDSPIDNAEKTQSLSVPNNLIVLETDDGASGKARVSIRTLSQEDTVPDGGQWRKYGEKVTKGYPPCPRSYYRCSLSNKCPVKKQIQRCHQDTRIVCTTYEGYHNHPLPPDAREMAQRTSSAARMMLTGSTSSNDANREANLVTRTSHQSSSTSSTIGTCSKSPILTREYTQSSNNRSRLTKMPQNISTTFSGLQKSSKNGANSSRRLVVPNIDETVNALIAADPNFTNALASAINFIMRSSSQSTSSATTSSAAANGTGSSNDNGKQQN